MGKFSNDYSTPYNHHQSSITPAPIFQPKLGSYDHNLIRKPSNILHRRNQFSQKKKKKLYKIPILSRLSLHIRQPWGWRNNHRFSTPQLAQTGHYGKNSGLWMCPLRFERFFGKHAPTFCPLGRVCTEENCRLKLDVNSEASNLNLQSTCCGSVLLQEKCEIYMSGENPKMSKWFRRFFLLVSDASGQTFYTWVRALGGDILGNLEC